jgi:DNA ligase-associated metallophosphoesterase
VFLGDFLHAAQAKTTSLLAELDAWRQGHAALPCVLVRGNHDSRAGDPPLSLDIETVDEPWPIGPFAACHHPQKVAARYVIAGHLHPALTLRGPGRDRLRLPCFSFDERCAVLPAFGEFTGGWQVERQPGRTLYAVGGQAVWRVPAGR